MEFIVDIQYFSRCSSDMAIIKELAILSRNGQNVGHWTFQPSFDWSSLNDAEKRSANWVISNHHGLQWDQGDVPYIDLVPIITTIIPSTAKIYVKRNMKKKILSNFSFKNIINLETPPSLKQSDIEKSCWSHAPHFICALRNVYTIKKMLDEEELEKKFSNLHHLINDINQHITAALKSR